MKILLALLCAATSAFAQTYYLPPGVPNLRAMIVGGTPLVGGGSQIWRDFCAVQRVGLAQSVADLPAIAAASGHPEIANAPFVTCGTSAGANAATATALANPTRSIAVVGLHGAMMALGNDGFNANRSGENGDVPTFDFTGAYGLPMIHNFDNNDGFVSPVTLQGLVEFGRARGAPWTFFIHDDGNHTDNDLALTTLIFPWLAAVLDLRLPAGAGTGDGSVTLNVIVESDGWLGNIQSGVSASYATYASDRTKAAWFPNQSVATIWSGYHFLPPYNIPPQPIVAPSGLIADLTILDPVNNDTTSGTGWKVNANFKEADQTGSLWKYFLMAPPPASVAGLDWIRPITPGKTYSAFTADPIFTFRVTADVTVFIAHSDAGTSRPAWLATWVNTGEQLVVTSGNLNANAPRYTLFRKDFAANAIVTCGANGTPPPGHMYITLVKPLGAPTLPAVSVEAPDASATEGGDSGAFTITRTGDTTNALTVNFTVSGTATSGSDYTALGTSAVISAGQSSAALTVSPVDDVLVEGAETVTLSLASSATYALGAITSATVNIADNNTSSLAVVTIVATDADAGEPGNSGTWTVTRTGSTTAALVVSFSTSGTAPRAVDYTLTGPTGTTLNILAGQSSRTITLNVTNDTLVESTETAICTISANAAYTVGSPSSATITITDDDSGTTAPTVTVTASDANAAEPGDPGAWTLTRTGDTSAVLTVNFTLAGTATRTTDYTVDAPPIGTTLTFPGGAATLVVPLTVVDDTAMEATETAILTVAAGSGYTVGSPASATINLADDDTPITTTPPVTLSSTDLVASEAAGNTATITFTRAGSTANALTLSLLIGGDAQNGVDVTTVPASLVIAAGQSTATLTITALDDSLIEGAETLAVTLASSATYTVGTPATLGVIVNDNDNAAPLTTIGIVFATHVSGANTREIKLNVYRPATGVGPWPVLIYYPGGGWVSQNEGSINQLFLNLTAHGYAVVSANYVTSTFAKWPAQIQDAKAAVRWVRANAATYGFDPARIGVAGTSSGGHMAAYVGVSGGLKTARIGSEIVDLVGTTGGNFTQSDVVQACAPFFPPTDLLVMDHYPTPDVPDHNGSSPETGLIGAFIQTVPEKTATANPIALVRAGLPPFWITHGSADRSVNFNQSELLNGALAKAAQPVTFWPVPGAGHGGGVSDSQEVHGLLKAFLDRYLKGLTTNAPPVATFTASTLSGVASLTVDFDASESTDADGVITKYSWATGDDEGGAGATLTYTYPRAGTYPVCLSVRDDRGATTSITAHIIVSPAGSASATPPTITLTGPTDGFRYARTGDLMLQTTAAASGGATIASVEYFLNGQPIAFDHKTPYNTTLGSLPPGPYTATARVSDSTGASTISSPIDFHVFGETDMFQLPALTAGQLSLTYYRFTDGTLNYTFARSDNLANWTPFAPTQTILSDGPQIQWMRATDPLGVSGISRRFLRIGVAPAP